MRTYSFSSLFCSLIVKVANHGLMRIYKTLSTRIRADRRVLHPSGMRSSEVPSTVIRHVGWKSKTFQCGMTKLLQESSITKLYMNIKLIE